MVRPNTLTVLEDARPVGTVDADAMRPDDPDRFVALTRYDGTIEHVPTAALSTYGENAYQLDRSRCTAGLSGGVPAPGGPGTHTAESRVIPVIEETAEVTKRTVPAATTRIEKHVRETTAHFEEQLKRDHVDVRRVPVNRVVDQPPGIRHDGETTIIPILEERVVKVLVLREELHVTRRHDTHTWAQDVPLRHEEVEVRRTDVSSAVPPPLPGTAGASQAGAPACEVPPLTNPG